jgi:DeoR/GlpR family transcriptional regulator of sugar metabolism
MQAVEGIQQYNTDKVIVSCKAFDITNGFTDSSEETVCVKRAMLKAGQVRIMAVDSSKFERKAFCKIVDLKEIDYIVTDKRPEDEILYVLEKANVNIIYPKE